MAIKYVTHKVYTGFLLKHPRYPLLQQCSMDKQIKVGSAGGAKERHHTHLLLVNALIHVCQEGKPRFLLQV
jgi:hypothetical protein